MFDYKTYAIVVVMALSLSGCAGATKYFVQGGPYVGICEAGAGHYNNAPNGSCPDFMTSQPK